MTVYKILVIVHVFSAILGLGPGFVLSFIAINLKTFSQVKWAFHIRDRIHIFVMTGGFLLLVTGIWMGLINTALWKQGWFTTSLILYVVALAISPLLLRKLMKPIKAILANHKEETIPPQYVELSKKLFFYEHVMNGMFIIIIFLMITKPF